MFYLSSELSIYISSILWDLLAIVSTAVVSCSDMYVVVIEVISC